MNNLINHVSPETAARLKAAGFPQPVKEIGQTWYSPKGELWIVSGKPWRDVFETIAKCVTSWEWEWPDNMEGFAYAPTATDILRELGEAYSLEFSANEYAIYYFDSDGRNYENSHTNPHELCALEWLKIHEKPAQK